METIDSPTGIGEAATEISKQAIEIREQARRICWPLVFVFAILTVISLFIWLTNVEMALLVAHQRMRAQPVNKVTPNPEVTRNPEDDLLWSPKLEKLAPKALEFFYKIDLSTVTSLLIMAFLFRICMGCYAVAKNRLHLVLRREFPFPARSTINWIQLGLLGTIWGFMLLGFGLRNQGLMQSDEGTIRLLVEAFGTALLSTFTAVFLAYVAAPRVKWLFSMALLVPVTPQTRVNSSAAFTAWLSRSADSLAKIAETIDSNHGALKENLSTVVDKVSDFTVSIEKHHEKLAKIIEAFHKKLEDCISDDGPWAALFTNVDDIKEHTKQLNTKYDNEEQRHAIMLKQVETVGDKLNQSQQQILEKVPNVNLDAIASLLERHLSTIISQLSELNHLRVSETDRNTIMPRRRRASEHEDTSGVQTGGRTSRNLFRSIIGRFRDRR